MKPTVLIGFAEALSAPEVAWSLIDDGFKVVAFSRRNQRAALRHSRFVQVFDVTPPERDLVCSQEDLKGVVAHLRKESNSPIVIMPLDDPSLWLCGTMDFQDRIVLVGPQAETLNLALDKRKQLALAGTAGFSVPPFKCIERAEDIAKEQIVYPVVFKPALAVEHHSGTLSRGHGWICADQAELTSAVSRWAERGPMLLQQFVPGVGEGIFGLATSQGVVAWSGHRRVRMMNPQGSGSSACTTVLHIEEETKTAAERFLQTSGWHGLFMIELLRDESGKLWFIEFNGRAWGSMALARRGGLEYPAWAVQKVLDPESLPGLPTGQKSVRICRHLAREFIHLLFVLRGSKSKALVRWPSIWTALSQVCRIGRKDCWYNWRRDDPKVFFSDCFGTVWAQLVGSKKQP